MSLALLMAALIAALLLTLGILVVLLAKSSRLALDRRIWELRRGADALGGALPSVTVIVPARNEERNITACLESVLAFDYPRLQVLAVDDGSTDRTRELAESVAARSDSRLRVIDGRAFDSSGRGDWACAKSFVLWNASRLAQGDWILFVDCDTRQRPDGLWRAMQLAREEKLDALSASGLYRNPGLWGDVLESLMYAVTFVTMPLGSINDPSRPVGWLNGQFILIRREAYLEVGGHEAVKQYAFDDMSLGRHLKEKGRPYRFLPAAKLFACINYVGLRQAMRGWWRLLTATGWLGHGKAFFGASMLAIALTCILPFATLTAAALDPAGDPALLWLAGVQASFVVLLHAAMRAEMKSPVWRAALLPVAACLAVIAFAGGYRARFHARRIDFRGRPLPADPTIRA